MTPPAGSSSYKIVRAAAYVRYSSDNQREESIDAQVRAIRDYCERSGIALIKIYPDEAKSATTDNRPQFLQMIADAAMNMFDVVIVHKLDRFARDRYDSQFYKRELSRHGVRLLSVLESLDGSPESVILESVLEGMSEYYSKNLAREVIKGMKETAYQCKHTGGLPPLGYDVAKDKSYTINEYEAEAVRLIFERYAAGIGYVAILDELRDLGYKTKRGQAFGKNSLNNILNNEKYTGTYIFNRAAAKVAGKRNNHKSKDVDEIIRIPGGMPAIITDETWEKARQRMNSNRRRHAAYRAHVVYQLSGRTYCGDCGGAMVGKHFRGGRNKTEYCYYECGTRKRLRTCEMKPINQSFIEPLVINTLYQNIFSPEALPMAVDLICKYAQEQKKEIPGYLRSLKQELAKVEREIKNMVDAIAAGMFHESMKEKMDKLEGQRAILLARKAESERTQKNYSISRQEIKLYLQQFQHIKTMEPEKQKLAIEQFIFRVTVYEEYIDIDVRPWAVPSGGGGGPAPIEPEKGNKKILQPALTAGGRLKNLRYDGGGEGNRTAIFSFLERARQ